MGCTHESSCGLSNSNRHIGLTIQNQQHANRCKQGTAIPCSIVINCDKDARPSLHDPSEQGTCLWGQRSKATGAQAHILKNGTRRCWASKALKNPSQSRENKIMPWVHEPIPHCGSSLITSELTTNKFKHPLARSAPEHKPSARDMAGLACYGNGRHSLACAPAHEHSTRAADSNACAPL